MKCNNPSVAIYNSNINGEAGFGDLDLKINNVNFTTKEMTGISKLNHYKSDQYKGSSISGETENDFEILELEVFEKTI